ncbi:hypothetical protein K440DRAFT_278554 [Wilcoxina mikolae CBS 423.85]|nr:hypothetical protein K440DRAFT_278554 [Wilcoxina mikolae CBS 423.85]
MVKKNRPKGGRKLGAKEAAVMFVHTLHIIRASTYFAAICRLLGLKSVTTPQTGLPHRLPRPFNSGRSDQIGGCDMGRTSKCDDHQKAHTKTFVDEIIDPVTAAPVVSALSSTNVSDLTSSHPLVAAAKGRSVRSNKAHL